VGHRRLATGALLLAAVLSSTGAWADSEFASVKVAMPVLLKVLTYDLNFESRGYGEFVVLVASEPTQQAQREQLMDVLKGLSVVSVKTRPIKFVAGEFKDAASLDADVQRAHAGAILAVPGLTAEAVAIISDVGQDNQIYTLALDAAMVEKAIAIGVTQSAGRPQIIINERASKALGVKFETSVLKLAKVIQ
jgi:hypothetical protein